MGPLRNGACTQLAGWVHTCVQNVEHDLGSVRFGSMDCCARCVPDWGNSLLRRHPRTSHHLSSLQSA
eukprot:11785179-Alexandrium_andersonii.AAC.1